MLCFCYCRTSLPSSFSSLTFRRLLSNSSIVLLVFFFVWQNFLFNPFHICNFNRTKYANEFGFMLTICNAKCANGAMRATRIFYDIEQIPVQPAGWKPEQSVLFYNTPINVWKWLRVCVCVCVWVLRGMRVTCEIISHYYQQFICKRKL